LLEFFHALRFGSTFLCVQTYKSTNGDKFRDREKAKRQKDLIQAVMRWTLGLFGHVYVEWKITEKQKMHDEDYGGNREARKTMHRVDG